MATGSRFFRRGKSKMLFGLEVADRATPTREELEAAVDMSEDIADIAGFELTNSPIQTPNLANQFTPQIEGEDTVADSSLTLYDRDGSDDIRAAVEKGTPGFIFMLPYGDVPGKRMEVWPARSNGTNDLWTVGNDPARFNAPFSVTGVPEQNAEVPAAS